MVLGWQRKESRVEYCVSRGEKEDGDGEWEGRGRELEKAWRKRKG